MRTATVPTLLRRWLAVLLLTSLAAGLAAMYTMHVGVDSHRGATTAAPMGSAMEPAVAASPMAGMGPKAQHPVTGVPAMDCVAFEVLCVLPASAASQPPAVQTTAPVFALATLVLLPALRRSVRFALPPPSLHVLSISRT